MVGERITGVSSGSPARPEPGIEDQSVSGQPSRASAQWVETRAQRVARANQGLGSFRLFRARGAPGAAGGEGLEARAVTRLDPAVLAHLEWLGFVQPTGLVVSAAALVRAGALLDRRDAEGQVHLKACVEERWFPAVENRGEGIFLQLRADAVASWLARPSVEERLDALAQGHKLWAKDRKSEPSFSRRWYALLHTFSHFLIQSLSMRCGYPASSIRERVYADAEAQRHGVLLFTGSPDAEGTLGGLVQQARHVEEHLFQALRTGALCSNDPICAEHAPGESMEGRWLHGAACHGCALIAETSCEMRNDYLDRALLVPVLGVPGASFSR